MEPAERLDLLGHAETLASRPKCLTGSSSTASQVLNDVLAERISAATGIPWHAVDDLTWEPGWVLVPEDEQRRRIEPICASDRWVLDTAYGAWLEVPLARADLVVALDYPRWLSLSRLLRRRLARAIDGRPICNGNRESFRNLFQRDSIVAWHFRSFSRKRTRMRAWEADPGLPQVLRFTQPAQVQRWLRTLAPSGELSEPVADPGA